MQEENKDLEVAVSIISAIQNYVQAEIERYKNSLKIMIAIRQDVKKNPDLKQKFENPGSMAQFLIERGIPEIFANSMTAEEFKQEKPQVDLAPLTVGCCVCTGCCITEAVL
jgi:hypothetical protein